MDIELTLSPDADYEEMPTMIQNKIYALFIEKAESVVRNAKLRARVKTGLMQSMIGFDVLPDGISVYCACPYGSFQDQGTKYISPSYFMTDSVREGEAELEGEIDDAVLNCLFQLEAET